MSNYVPTTSSAADWPSDHSPAEGSSVSTGRPSWVNPDPLWTVDQFAVYLSLKPAYVRQLIKERRIPIVKLGGKVMLQASTANAMIMEGLRVATRPVRYDRFGHPQ